MNYEILSEIVNITPIVFGDNCIIVPIDKKDDIQHLNLNTFNIVYK